MLLPYSGQAFYLDQVADADGLGLWVILVAGDFDPTLSSGYVDFTQATFIGSDPQQLTFGTARSIGCRTEKLAVPLVFECTTPPGSPELIYGYIIVGGASGPVAGTDLVAVHRFEAPVPIANAGDAVAVRPVLTMGSCGEK